MLNRIAKECCWLHGRRPGAEFGGDQTIFSRLNFRKNFHFQGKNYWWPFFSRRPGSSDFPFLFPHFPYMFTMLNVVYDHFLTRKTQFFTLFMLSRTFDNMTSQNIGGTNAWAVPHLKFWGGQSPQSPLGLRLWLIELCWWLYRETASALWGCWCPEEPPTGAGLQRDRHPQETRSSEHREISWSPGWPGRRQSIHG